MTSPKGSTIAAVRALEKAGLRFNQIDIDDHGGRHEDYDDPDCHNVTLNKSRAAMMDAVAAAVERSNISSNSKN